MSKKIITGRNSIVLFAENEASRAHNSALAYNDDGVVLPADVVDEDLPTFRDEGDYRYFMFRHISKTIVGANTWKATDFSNGNVLKKSTPMLNKKPAYKSHMTWVGEALGQVVNPVWVNAYTNSQGQEIPAGIDAEFAMNMKIPSLQELIMHLSGKHNPYDAASVGIVFEWEASHQFESMWDFYDHMGEMITDEDGKETMVRRIVTNVEDYHESSLVAFGADIYARQKDSNNEVNFEKAIPYDKAKGGVYMDDEDPFFKSEFEEKSKYYVFSSGSAAKKVRKIDKKPEESLDLSESKKKTDMEKDNLITFALTLLGKKSIEEIEEGFALPEVKVGVTYTSLVEQADKAVGFEADALTAKSTVSTFQSEKEAADKRVVELTGTLKLEQEKAAKLTEELEATKSKVAYADDYKQKLVDKAKAVYTAKEGGNPSELILKEFEANDIPTLQAKIKAYGGDIGFSGKCKDCGSNKFEFRSSEEKEKEVIESDKVAEDDFSLSDKVW